MTTRGTAFCVVISQSKYYSRLTEIRTTGGHVPQNFVGSGKFLENLALHEQASMAEKGFRSGKNISDFGKSGL